jgi:hypothetical protein
VNGATTPVRPVADVGAPPGSEHSYAQLERSSERRRGSPSIHIDKLRLLSSTVRDASQRLRANRLFAATRTLVRADPSVLDARDERRVYALVLLTARDP